MKYFSWPKRNPAKPFIDHMELIIPDKTERDRLLGFMASLIQRPGHKLHWAPIMVHWQRGCGSLLIFRIMESYLRTVQWARSEVLSGFNSELKSSSLCIFEATNLSNAAKVMIEMKPLITSKDIEIRAMGKETEFCKNITNFILIAASEKPYSLAGDRRFFSINVGSHCPSVFARAREFANWLTHKNGIEIAVEYLKKYPIPDSF